MVARCPQRLFDIHLFGAYHITTSKRASVLECLELRTDTLYVEDSADEVMEFRSRRGRLDLDVACSDET